MGLIGVQRTISSAGLPGADGVVVDFKIFFRCCCWFSKYSFIDVVVGWKVFFGCWRFLFINFSLARCGPQQASQASSRLVKWLSLIVCFAFQDDESRIATCTQRPW